MTSQLLLQLFAGLLFQSLLVFSGAVESETHANDAAVSHYSSLVEWIKAEGGYVNPKQEYRRRLDDEEINVEFGMFASAPISKGETLFRLPWDLIITGGPDRYGGLHCKTIQALIQEIHKGKESHYAPYIEYLLSLPNNTVPSAWSEEGKDLLELILGYEQLPPDEPVLWLIKDFEQECDGSSLPLDQNAAMLVLSKGDDDLMVPLLDFYNHRNGKFQNADLESTPGEFQELFATRAIKEGEEIHLSLNQCRDCDDRKYMGTPELLRDHGFVEAFPQSYNFHWLKFGFTLIEKNNGELKVSWARGNKPSPQNVAYMQSQLTRLETLVRPELVKMQGDESIPVNEWNALSKLFDSIVLALASAIQAAGGVDESSCSGETDDNGRCIVNHGYDELADMDIGFVNYQSYCDNHDIVHMKKDSMRLIERQGAKEVQSPYQLLTFIEGNRDGVKDTCLELDDMLQICTSFRPHYHDYVTHFPARYKQEIKRVLFVGGGDSMVLHEMLKYPNIELIVGLELDQTVVRESMKHFRTQPHFDDERVQWWFGDATKSLLMLPKDYFGSFDMVMVDLSESVMSFSVIKHVDIMEALTLLLKPDGIMIKNDLHFRKMSDIFDYTIQFSVTDVPVICEQAFVVGSNTVDFLRPDIDVLVKGHGVDMPLLEPVKNLNDSFKLVQKYRKNDARAQGKCDNLINDSDVKLKRAGIFMVVEAENAKGPFKGEKLEKRLLAAVQAQGLTYLSTVSNDSETKGQNFVILLKEGVVVARTWPKEKYCAFDIHLWGRFKKMESLRDALTAGVGSDKASVSSFRIIVGGMRGTETWTEDKQEIGPKIIQNRDCEKHGGRGIIDQSVTKVVVEAFLNLIEDENPVVAVICGMENEPCSSLDVAKQSDKVKAVIPLWTCKNVENAEFAADAQLRMSTCEHETLKALRESVAEDGAISGLVLDINAPISIARIMRNILANPRYQRVLLMPRILAVAPMGEDHESWRTSFLDRSRSNLMHQSVFRVEMELRGENDEVEVGILSAGSANFFPRLVEFADSVESRTGIQVEVHDIIGAPPKGSNDYEPKYFSANDYDLSRGEAQFAQQRPLGHHVVSQLKIDKPVSSFSTNLSEALENSLEAAGFSNRNVQVLDGMGDGAVAVVAASEGTGVAVWDGNQRITLNLFTFDSEKADPGFKKFIDALSSAKVLSKDEQPRGIGKVVNFARDLL